ncbi:hypothetical protein, partial [Azospirillum griseum]|uniref:hypothetical protein n=1 Tax=Azospirillum griseum TaxID=2496639 RepID=UPI001AEC7F67
LQRIPALAQLRIAILKIKQPSLTGHASPPPAKQGNHQNAEHAKVLQGVQSALGYKSPCDFEAAA